MNQHLQTILDFIQQAEHLNAEEKAVLLKAAKNADKELEITSFKLERTEKVKHTTAILLEETIEELEQKRKAVEAQNRELEIESALERVRSVALAMKGPDDMLDVCKVIATELNKLDVKEIRNVQTAIFYETKGVYINYEFYAKHDKTLITEVDYSTHTVQSAFAEQMMKGPNEFFTQGFTGKQVQDWYAYQKTTNVFLDSYLEHSSSLNYYWYSLGPVALGMSTYLPLSEEQIILFQRFRNVFGLAYRRYLDIEQALAQAKEARIETALERVRAVAMAMRKPDELALICTTIYTELTSLDFSDLRNAEIIINNDSKETIISYYSDYGVSDTIEIDYKTNLIVQGWANELRKANDAFVEITIAENEMDAWRKYREEIGYLPDAKLNEAKTVYYYSYSIGLGALSISSFRPITKEQIKILERFRNVFKLSYQRYIDIEQAEAQAREAQIQLALERVRARTMAMQHSDELQQAAKLLFQQVKTLGLPVLTCGYNIWEKEEKVCTAWMSSEDGLILPSFTIPLTENETFIRFYESRQKGESFYVFELSGEALAAHYKYMLTLPAFGEIIDGFLKSGFTLPTFQINHVINFSHGNLIIVTYQPVPEAWDVFKRFTAVFEQTYTRFLDLQKAEAQAREAQIELALERVRARTMAMYRSDELSEVVYILFQQFKELGENPDQATIGIINEDEWVIEYWVTMYGNQNNKVYKFSIDEPNVTNRIYRAWKEQKKFLVIDLSGQELHDFTRYRASMGGAAAKEDEKRRIINVAFFSKGLINVQSNEERSAESIQLLERFSQVFDLTYTRFLDLQKAEAQAREAQIEVALERVRSRSMGMQKSEELKEVIRIVYEQFVHLNINIDHAGFVVDYKQKGDWHFWIADEQEIPSKITHPYFDSVWANQFNEAKEKGIDFFATSLNFEEKNKFYKELLSYVPGLPEESKNFYLSAPGVAASTVLFDNVSLYIENFSGIPYTDDENVILMRFGKVFEQTYTRFLDLQKAEAQVREAKIEAALEKVRSRSLAMHKSEELQNVVSVVFEKLTEFISIQMDGVSILIPVKESKDIIEWVAAEGKTYPESFRTPYIDNPILTTIVTARDSGVEFLAKVFDHEEKNALWKYAFEHSGYKNLPEEMKKRILESKDYAYSVAFQKNSAIIIASIAGQVLPEDESEILKRFAKVFEQAYIRFLDLQKAEAQSRESQIQLALERARTQSMIMQHSNELDDTLRVFHAQVLLLEIPSAFSFLWLPDEDKDRHIFWAAWAENNSTVFKSKAINYPLDRNEPATAQCLIDWKSNEPVVAYHVAPASVKDYFVAWDELITGVDELKPENFSDGLYYVEAFMKYGCFGVMVRNTLPEDEKKILNRFAVEFERAYTRFLDLQKAEAQAKEGQVQLALERVRARTMAMQHSNELPDAANILFQQIQTLGMPAWSAGYCIWDDDKQAITLWMSSAGIIQKPFRAPVTEDPSFIHFYDAWKRGETFYVEEIGGNAIISHYQYMLQLPVVGEMLKQFIAEGGSLPTFQIYHLAFFSQGFLLFITYEPVPEAHDIFKRFGKVFEQTYTRFLDLQKAEAQSRESQIQLALERVRARTMAMQHSDELKEAAALLFQQVKSLGAPAFSCGYNIWEKNDKTFTSWMSTQDGSIINGVPDIPLTEDANFIRYVESKQKGEQFFVLELHGERMLEHYQYLKTIPAFKAIFDYSVKAGIPIPETQIQHVANFSNGNLLFITLEPCPEFHDVFKRFAAVFEQTYTRFLDLQKAEAQAKESQIQLAMERVRARTMAMQHSNELAEAASLLFKQVNDLGINPWGAGFNIWQPDGISCTAWMANPDGGINPPFKTPHTEDSFFKKILAARQRGEEFFVFETGGEELEETYRYMYNLQTAKEVLGNLETLGFELPKFQVNHCAFFSQGYLLFITHEQSPEAHDIFKRFAKVFEQTYTRFLDLQKAETQAREAKIEVAMEKVRSRAMAMQKPAELVEVAQLLRKEMNLLGVEELETSSIYIHHEETGKTECWYAIKDVVHPEKELVSDHMTIDLTETWVGKEMLAFYHSGKKQISISMQGTNRKEWINYCAAHSKVLVGFYGDNIPDRTYHLYKFSNGYIGAASPGDISTESWDLLQRATSVFSLAYTRFSDLQQAEAQAREANIETALERVRSRTLAMHKSDELAETAAVVFKQLISLGIEPNRLYIGIIKDNSGEQIELWATDEDGTKVSTQFTGNINRNQSIKKMYEGWKTQQRSITIDMQGKELEGYFHYLSEELKVPFQLGLTQKRRVQTIAYFSQGFIGMASPDPQPDETTKLLERFAYVFNLTYTRFNDLQHAEEQTRKAQIEVALERVRARALAMQSSNELIEVANAMREQMGILGQPDLETTAVHLYTNGSETFDSWYAFRPGRKSIGDIVTGTAKFRIDSCEVLRELLAEYHSGINEYTIELSGPEMNEWLTVLSSAIPVITSSMFEEFKEIPSKTYFHVADFSGGSLVMVTYQPPSEESMNLQKRAASVFDLAYRRFLDLQHKEEQALRLLQEKERLEFTLTELKATQSQLIQSEKMASLGELTAGIAHEIQNPLNFVNNFSEVNTELIEELKEELKQGNTEEVIAIANDIKDNEEKINHHGKRADAIVKGMLQHSRSSSATKEPTDINKLADEYLRLAYHGLRAKDKSFNATLNTAYDDSIGTVHIISQDIGRVILNLIMNAFYTVTEKKKQAPGNYEPTVSITTKKINDTIEIKVADNGNGIPQKVINKIFQPFFTTKPTGQGTGLGLSLAYDIIKAHGGGIKVETKDNEGSVFIIELPVV